MLNHVMNLFHTYLPIFVEDEEGQDLAEYALVLVLIAIVAVAGVTTLGGTIANTFTTISGNLGGGGGGV